MENKCSQIKSIKHRDKNTHHKISILLQGQSLENIQQTSITEENRIRINT